MSENNDFRHEEQGYNNPENLYHFNYNEQHNAPGDPGWAEEPAAAKKPSFWQKAGVKVTALLPACAVVGGAAGYGGAALSSSGKTTIRQSNRTASEITVKQVSGQTLMSPAEVYASTVNSVVSINCSSVSTNIFGQSVQSASSGSGFIITQDGYIVTNNHVVEGAEKLEVTMNDNKTYNATIIGTDANTDGGGQRQ